MLVWLCCLELRISLFSFTDMLNASTCSVAKKMVSSSLQKRPPFNIYFGLEGWMLSSLTAGMSPAHNIVDSLCQIFLKGLLRFVSLFYLMDFRNTLHKVAQKNVDKGKEDKSYGAI